MNPENKTANSVNYPGKHEAAKSSRLPITDQEKLIVQVGNAIEDLENKLAPVLLPELEKVNATEPTSRVDEGGVEEAPRSDLGKTLIKNNMAVLTLLRRLERIADRVEL
jgi:hypothetical protein